MKSLTLTTYTLEKGDRYMRGTHHYLIGLRSGSSLWDGAVLTEHTHTYSLGMRVQVHSFGAWRPGTVTGIKRSQVEVTFQRNKKGLLHTKRFPAEHIRPMSATS